VVVADGQYIVTGNTFPIKRMLSSIGFKWNSAKKGWVGSSDKVEKFKENAGENTLKRVSIDQLNSGVDPFQLIPGLRKYSDMSVKGSLR